MDERDEDGTQRQEEQLGIAKAEAEQGKGADDQLGDELHTDGGGESTSRDDDQSLTGTDPAGRGQNEA